MPCIREILHISVVALESNCIIDSQIFDKYNKWFDIIHKKTKK